MPISFEKYLILFSSALELFINNNIIMNILIVDAARDKFFLELIIDKNIYTCSYENSKSNFEKMIILINDFLKSNKSSLNQINKIYVKLNSINEKGKNLSNKRKNRFRGTLGNQSKSSFRKIIN